MLLASWDSYLPTHPASLIPGLPQLAPLLAALTLLAVVWSLGRLILQIIFTRFLHAHISIGRVGWASLNDIEWSLLRNAKGTRTAKVQRVRIQRIALTLRGRGAKDNDIRLAWLGLAIRGVSVEVKLVPSTDSHGSDPSTLESSDGASSDGHASYPASPTRTQAFSPTPNFASLTFSSRTNTSPPPSQPSLMRQIAQILLNSFKTIHNIRRRARRILVKCIPEPKRRTLFRSLRQATRFLRHRIAAPVLTQINSFGRSCNIITMFLAMEITDITVDIPQLESQVNIGLIRLGGELVRRSKNYVGLWTRLEHFYVVRQAKSESKAYEKVQSSASKAVEVAGPLLMEAQAHFDPSIGMAALYHRTETGSLEPRKSILSLSFSFLRASSSFSKDEKVTTTSTGGAAGGMVPSSIKIRLNTLLWVIDKMKKTIDPDPQLHFGPHMGVHLHARELNGDHARSDTPHSRTESDAPTFEQEGPSRIFGDYPQRPVIPTSRNPAAMLKSIAFSIPLVKVEARLPKLSEKPRTPIAAHQHMQIEMRLRGLAAEAVVGKMLNSDDRHLHWFGRTTPLKLAAKLGFEKFDIDAAAIMPESCERKPVAVIPDPLLMSVYPASLGKPVRLVEVSPSGLHISSSWLPPRADALFRESHRQPDFSEESGANAWETSVEPTSPVQKDNRQDSERDMDERSSGLAVIEADVGGVNGEAGLEMVQGLLLVLAAHRAKTEALKQTQNEETDRFSESEATSKSWQACSPPTVAVVVELGRCGYRIMGPKVSHRASFGPGEDDAETSPGFSNPSLVAVHILSLAITMQTRYADVPVHRTEAQRRELKQEIKRGSIFVPNILFRGSQSQRASEMRAREIRRRMFDSPRVDEDQEEWSQSMSPVSPNDTADTGHDMQRPDGNKAKSPIPLTASFSRDNGFLCFVTRDDGQMPEYARRIAANHAATHREVQEHPFVYFIDATVTCQKVDIYLLDSQDQQPASVRSNPTSASSDGSRRGPGSSNARSHTTNPHTHGHTRRQSRPPPTKRFDVLSLDSVELAVNLEVLGHELSTGEHGLDQAVFVSLVDLQDTHGSVGLACDGLRTEASRVEVHHCLSALLHLSNKMPAAESGNDSETLASFTSQSTATRSDQTLVPQRRAPRVQPLAQALPANISFSVGLANIECFVAGPDPKYMPDVCRGLALKISQFTLQRYRQNRYVAPQSHAHIRAPLGLPPDLRAHAQSVFNETGDKEQAFVTVRLQALRVNPLRDTGKDNKILRAKVPVNASGRNTTGDVDTEYIKNSTWCSLPRNQFFPNLDSCTDKSEASADRDSNYQKQDKAPFEVSAAKVRDFFLIPEIDARITMWTRPVETTVDSETSPTVQRTRQSTGSTDLPTFQDCIGLSVRIPSVILRVEMTQIYCSLLAYSAIRSLMPPKDVTNAKASGTRQRIHWQIKCNVLRTHIYWTLPHNVKLYMHLRRVDVSTHKEGLQVELESATFAGESHICRGLWEDIVKIRKWTLIYRKEAETGNKHDQITLKGEGGRLRIPCKYPFSEIVDNLVTCVKLSKQLAHQFVKGKFSSAIEPRAEAPKHVPEIRITMAVLVLEAADDPFEAKLNLIWSAGKEQQTHRLRREAIFHERLASLREQEQEAPREAPANARLSEDGGQAIHLSFPAAHVDDEKQGPGHPTQQRQPSIIHLRQRFLREQSRQWIKSVKESQAHRLREEERHLKQLYGKTRSNDDELPIQLLNHHGNTPLMRVVLGDLDVKLSRPTFDVDNGGLADFLYDVGKGMPRDTQYSLIIPFHLDWRMNEAKVHIRDYPIPLLDIPKFVDDSKSAPDGTQSWHLATDFVIAEELAGADSIRHVSATVVPAEHGNPHNSSSGYFYRIPRTAMPVKFYALPIVTVTSDSATRLCWGNSIQPAIQDVMRVMDSLTKPPPDPSERLGFWDKIRLILHWQIQINFEGAGPLHLILKGSRDPYQVTGIGAGFALSWHDGIKWRIGYDNTDREFFQIFSDRFVLGVPDLSNYDVKVLSGQMKERSKGDEFFIQVASPQNYSTTRGSGEQKLSKVCAKFQGGVRWGLGMQFERTCRPEDCHCGCEGSTFHRKCRLFDFRPHYKVKTISALDATNSESRVGWFEDVDMRVLTIVHQHHDSYKGFRSDFIHFSISVVANKPDSPANTLHLTPNGFEHFWAWWHLFDGTLSLPVRHGSVFASSLPPSKKFGKHCATIKYRIQLAPVYIAHTYKQALPNDLRKGFATVLGVKGKLESFNVDMHQREQETRTKTGESGEVKVRLHKGFHRVEVDCQNTDLRVLSARFTSMAVPDSDSDLEDAELEDFLDMDTANIVAPEDAEWIDDDDYLDLYTPLGERQPNMHLLACLRTPRLTYSRYAQHDHLYPPLRSSPSSTSLADDVSSLSNEELRETSKGPLSKFGYEPTHTCLFDRAKDALDVQLDVMQSRVAELEAELSVRRAQTPDAKKKDIEELEMRLRAAKMSVLRFRMYRDRRTSTDYMPDGNEKIAQEAEYADTLLGKEHIPEFHVFQDLDKWINRLMIHNPNVVVSQRIRDILLRYYYSSRQRRLFDYAMSAKAIKFIKDMAKDYQKGTLAHQQERAKDSTRSEKPASVAESVPLHEPEVMDLLDSLIKEATESRHNAGKQGFSYPQAHGNEKSQDAHITEPMTLLREELASNERSQNSFLVSVLKPQVCLCSEIGGQSSTVVIASQAVQLRICAVIDIDYIDDPINATVMHRSFGRIDALQVFYPHLRGWRSGRKESLLSHANAFVPLELLAGLASNTRDLDTIVAPTNAQLTYDKNNRLRLVNQTKKTSDVRAGGCDRTVDRFNVACDRFTVNATSVHFAAIYDVVTNLILYTDPSQKEVTQKTEELVLSQDFSDTADILRSVEKQQDILREHKRTYHKLLEAGPDSHTSSTDLHIDLMQRSAEMTGRKDVLTLWLKALQQAQANRSTTKGTGLRLDARAQEIVWHMREGDGKPLAKVAVNGVYFCWQNRSDGGVSNSLVIRDLNALNSGPDPYFSEIISKHPYSPTVMETRFMRADIFVAVIWSMLSPVGGIPIIDHFQVHLHPIRLQMEQSMADKIKHYFFTPREPRGSDEGQLAIAHESNPNSKASIPSNSDGSPNKNGSLQQLKVSNPSSESLGKPSQNGTKRPPSITSNLLSFPSSTSSQVSLPSSRPRSVIKMHEASLKSIVTRDDYLDADDMRERARSNRTFLHVELFPTVLCLSFKGDKSTTLPDVYGLIYKSPTIIHCNRIWTYLDLVEHIKKDFKSSIWSQSATLLGQLLTTARKPKNAVQQHVQQRLLSHVSDRGGDRDRRRSLTSTIRSRLSSVGAEDSKTSPLRSSYVRSGVAEEDSSDSDASSVNSGRVRQVDPI